MALINCEECGREVSDKAASCPGCGAPIAAAPAPSQPQPNPDDSLVTTQLTIQSLKKQQAFAVVIMLIGLMYIFVSTNTYYGRIVGFSATLIGLVWLILVKLQSRWRHD